MSEQSPTPDETRWASAILNAQKYGRSATDQDKQQAGQIMARARRASQARKARSVSPLEEARAIKAMEVAVAEAQGINDAREGAIPEAPPAQHVVEPPPITAPGGTPPEEIFRQSGLRVVADLDRGLRALQGEQRGLQERLNTCETQIAGIERRKQAILEAING